MARDTAEVAAGQTGCPPPSPAAVARYLVVLAEPDPVARAIAARWAALPASEVKLAGATVREVTPEVWALRRAGRHIHDEQLEADLALAGPAVQGLTVVFPSIHWSESGARCFTVHPLGNWGESADVGGRPRSLVPTAPRAMTAALRALSDRARTLGIPATFEATHHGPWLHRPSFFIEVGGGPRSEAPAHEEIAVIAEVLEELGEVREDRIALGIGGGHYVPHLTALALERHWAFGHLLPRHALDTLDPAMAGMALAGTPGCEGVVYSRATDADRDVLRALGPRLRDQDAPRRV